MLIKDLKDKYPLVYKRALECCNEGYNENSTLMGAFTWIKTKEGSNFWYNVNNGDFESAKTICPHLFESTWVPQVGDWVVVLPEDKYYYNCEKGVAQEICDIYKDEALPYKLKFSNGRINTYNKIRKAEPHEIPVNKEKHMEKIDMKIIQEEAKRRFPIGCKFKNTDGKEYTLLDLPNTYKISSKNLIYAHDGAGCLYAFGKWATLIEAPKQKSIQHEHKLTVGEYYIVEQDDFQMIGYVTDNDMSNSVDMDLVCKATYVSNYFIFATENKIWCYHSGKIRTYRKASYEERSWIMSCLKNKKYITYDDYLDSNDIKHPNPMLSSNYDSYTNETPLNTLYPEVELTNETTYPILIKPTNKKQLLNIK